MLSLMNEQDAIGLLVVLAILKSITMASVVIALVWFAKRLRYAEQRQDNVLSLAERYAALGAERREEAKGIIQSVVIEKTEELKTEVAKIPVETAKMVSNDAANRESGNSGVFKP